jgi:hypothetical protein
MGGDAIRISEVQSDALKASARPQAASGVKQLFLWCAEAE